jgi:PEP-CTERM motif
MRLHWKTGFAVVGIAVLASVATRPASAGLLTFDGYTMMGNGTTTLDGANLQLTQSQNSANIEYGSAFITPAYTIMPTSNFLATFSFSIQNNGTQNTNEFFPFQGNGGGFSFIAQNTTTGANTLYGGFTSAGFAANSNSLGIQFNADQPNNLSPSPTAGTVTITPPGSSFGATVTQNFDLQGGQPFMQAPNQVNNLVTGNVTIFYDASQSLLTVSATNSTGDSINFSDSLNLYNIITEGAPPASPTAYFGFEAQEGGGFLGLSQSEISNFSLSVGPLVSVPEPGTFGLLATGLVGVGLMLRRHRD